MPDTRDLITRNAVGALFNQFFEASRGEEYVPQLASQCCGVALQRCECDVTFGF